MSGGKYGFPNQTGKDVDQPLHKTIMVTPGSLWIMWFNCKRGRSTSYTSYKMWCVICDNVLWYGYLIPLLYAGIIIWRIARLYGPDAHTGLPLALGKHPRREGVNPPFAVSCCKSCLCRPNTHIWSPVPVFLSQNSSSTSESMGTCFTEGGVCDMHGNLGDPRPFTTREYSIYEYFSQYHVEYSSIWVPQGVLEYIDEYLEYLSTRVLSLSLDTKLKLIRNTVEQKIGKVPKIVGCRQLASALSVSQILKNVHRSVWPELIFHTKDTGHFNSLDLMFRHHICSSHLVDTSRRV